MKTKPLTVMKMVADFVNDTFPEASADDRLGALVDLSELWMDAELVDFARGQEEDEG